MRKPQFATGLRILDAFGTVATKCVDSSSSSKDSSTMRHSTSDEIFLARSHWYAFPIDDQCVASLHNNHVFVVIMGVRCGFSCVAAGPKCHLATIFSVKHITINSRSRLMGPRYPVCRMFHELRKIVHNAHSVTRQQTVALLSLISRRRHIHRFPRINCMKASIFFVI